MQGTAGCHLHTDGRTHPVSGVNHCSVVNAQNFETIERITAHVLIKILIYTIDPYAYPQAWYIHLS